MLVRLQKILAHAGIASRRRAEELIRQGRVEVNRRVVAELGAKADPGRDEIRVDGRRVNRRVPVRRYLLLYKPREVVSTRIDPQHRTTVIDLLQRAGIHGYFYPVGRLDHDSEGLILLTNDGEFAERVAHPRHALARTYEARVLGAPDARDLERLARGIVLDGRRTLPAHVRVRGTRPAGENVHTVLELVLREGRNRQIRRMCDAIGHPVVRLKRTRIGGIGARGMEPGVIRDLTPSEVAGLLKAQPTDGRGGSRRR